MEAVTPACLGAVEFSFKLMACCWRNIGLHVTLIFRACLRFGYHPTCFKLAGILFLSKPRCDQSSVKGWRPSALLSCLWKVIGRLLATRIFHLALITETVCQQLFGALPQKIGNGSRFLRVHDNEEAKAQGWASTPVTLYVEGTFDCVLCNRLIWWMLA